MPYITTADGTEIHYTDEGRGPTIVLSHGWPLSSEVWERELRLFTAAGYRVIAHDRRGHGRSGRPGAGHDVGTYARDLADLVDQLGLDDLLLVGHAVGAAEVIRFAVHHGRGRVRRIATAAMTAPRLLRGPANPEGVPPAVFDEWRRALRANPAELMRDAAVVFLGANRPANAVSAAAQEQFWRQGMQMGRQDASEAIAAFSEGDLTEDLRALEIPTFIVHGDDDQVVPPAATSERAIMLVARGALKIYPGAPHVLSGAYQVAVDEDILAFFAE